MRSGGRQGRVVRTARRGLAVAALGSLAALAGSVAAAPTASAEPAVTVTIRDVTPPVVSVDAGGTVTFVNGIEDEPVRVGGSGGLLPSVVDVTAHTDVTLRLPSGERPLPPGASVSEQFAQSCLTCTITYTYRLDSRTSLTAPLTDAALRALPPLPLPTPFVVDTLLPLPDLPSIGLPRLPEVTVPVPAPAPLPAPRVDGTPRPDPAPVPPAAAPQRPSIGGSDYTYGRSTGAARLAPTDTVSGGAATSRSAVPGTASGSAASGGAGGVAGGADGAALPVTGRLAGLTGGGEQGVDVAADASAAPAPGLSVPALAAVVALAGASVALARAVRAR